MTLTFYDSFHGVGGFRYGLEQAGMKCVGGCEIDKYACQAYGVINDEDCRPTDIRTVDPIRLPDFDIFVGGFPCQDLSVAGKRKGFDGERSVLFFEILRICEVKRPTYILLENVTGLFSHNGGETFRIVLQSLDELGYDAEWQMHNSAAYVPQNRERVFIIGHLRGRSTRPVFPFGRENENATEIARERILIDDQGRTTKELRLLDICPTLRAQSHGNEPKVLQRNFSGQYSTYEGHTGTLQASRVDKIPMVVQPVLTPDREEKRQNGRRFKEPGEPMFTLTAQDKHGVAISNERIGGWVEREDRIFAYQNDVKRSTAQEHIYYKPEGKTDAITVGHTPKMIDKKNYRIRKLTPLECFRLQSFPDEWYYKLKEHGISDSQLYKMAGNAVTSVVAYEIGRRLIMPKAPDTTALPST